jgi:hypothetical protein
LDLLGEESGVCRVGGAEPASPVAIAPEEGCEFGMTLCIGFQSA